MGELCQGWVLCMLLVTASVSDLFSGAHSSQGVLNHYFAPDTKTSPVPVDLLVTGSVPAGSGLSSSAAMVVASTLAFLAVNGKLEGGNTVTKGKLVEMSMENEKRVGKYRFDTVI